MFVLRIGIVLLAGADDEMLRRAAHTGRSPARVSSFHLLGAKIGPRLTDTPHGGLWQFCLTSRGSPFRLRGAPTASVRGDGDV